MRKRHIKKPRIDCFTRQGQVFQIPLHIANKYLVKDTEALKRSPSSKPLRDADIVDAAILFAEMDKKYTEAGVLLRGTRHREQLSQKDFAEKIKITQSDLSKMENGRRPIGKIIAKRIEKEFGVDYRYFLA
ncbi:MAG TPA: helix-turn-helix transcriptional regulator [Gammaproteobacteria bacterium]|nr:helix-turn-helix transcriptional regulator [Gammaproteobacteria bacterium]